MKDEDLQEPRTLHPGQYVQHSTQCFWNSVSSLAQGLRNSMPPPHPNSMLPFETMSLCSCAFSNMLKYQHIFFPIILHDPVFLRRDITQTLTSGLILY